MPFYHLPHPWNPGYAIPNYVMAEPLGRGTFTTRGLPRRTISTLPPDYLARPVNTLTKTQHGAAGSLTKTRHGSVGSLSGSSLGGDSLVDGIDKWKADNFPDYPAPKTESDMLADIYGPTNTDPSPTSKPVVTSKPRSGPVAKPRSGPVAKPLRGGTPMWLYAAGAVGIFLLLKKK